MNRQFELREVLSEALALAIANKWVIMGITAVKALVIAFSFLLNGLFSQYHTVALILSVTFALADCFIIVMLYDFFFKQIDQEADDIDSFPAVGPTMIKALNFLLVELVTITLVALLVVLLGVLYFFNSSKLAAIGTLIQVKVLIIAFGLLAAYVTLRTSFAICFIVDQDSGAIEAIRQSWALSRGHFWFLFKLFLVIIGINMLGAMAFFVGLLLTIPLSSLIIAITYRKLVNSYPDEEEEILVED